MLDTVINKVPLKNAVFRRKKEFLVCLQTAFESQTPVLYEKAIILLSEMLDIDFVNKSQIVSLNPQLKAIRALRSKKSIEDASYASTRHICALNVLTWLDKWEVDWSDEMSDECSKVNAVETLLTFLEQNAHDTYKAQAAQVFGMIAEHGSLNNVLFENHVVDILVEALPHKAVLVKRNASETLAFLLKDGEV